MKISRYQLVHEAFNLAKENERKDRVPTAEGLNKIYKTVKKPKNMPKYAYDACLEVTGDKEEKDKND